MVSVNTLWALEELCDVCGLLMVTQDRYIMKGGLLDILFEWPSMLTHLFPFCMQSQYIFINLHFMEVVMCLTKTTGTKLIHLMVLIGT